MIKKEMHSLKKTNYEEIMNKRLDRFYVIVQIVSVILPLGVGSILEKSRVYIIYGMNIDGEKTIIGMYVEDKENSRYWLEEMERIKRRGLEKILYVSTENNRRLEQAFRIVYNPVVKISVSEQVEKIAKYTQYRWQTNGERELTKAYLAETEEEYEEQMKMIKEKYRENHIGMILIEKFEKENRKEVKEIPKEIRHLICSYFTKRRMIDMGIRIVKEYEEIKDIEDLIEKRREFFSKFEKTRSYTKRRWTEILNKLYEEKYEEIKEYV